MEFTVEQIAQVIGGEIQGDATIKISKLAKIQEGDGNSLAFLSNPKYENYLYTTQAGAVSKGYDDFCRRSLYLLYRTLRAIPQNHVMEPSRR